MRILLVTLFLFLLSTNIFLLVENINIRSQYGMQIVQLKNKINFLEEQLEKSESLRELYVTELNKTKFLLEAKSEELQRINEKYLSCTESLSVCQTQLEYVNTSDILYNMRKEWLKQNFEYDFSSEDFVNRIEELCIKSDSLNVPCMVAVLKEFYSFEYLGEIEEDNLESIDEFISSRGGDCEDWSVFIASLIKYLRKKYGFDYLLLCKESPGSEFNLYIYQGIQYYLRDCSEYRLDLRKYNKFNVVCYKINATTGHCVLGASEEYLYPLNMGVTYFFEPQNGEFLGTSLEFDKDIYIILNEIDMFYKKWFWK